MSISMYSASAPIFRTLLGALSNVLGKGEEFAKAKNIDETVLLNSRLYPDMFALTRQVQIATDGSRGAMFRLAGREMPSIADDETSFAQLRARIATVLAQIESFTPADIDGSEEREIVIKLRAGELKFTGQRYLMGFAIPNFTFHCTTSYDILRHNGVELGKRDFLGAF